MLRLHLTEQDNIVKPHDKMGCKPFWITIDISYGQRTPFFSHLTDFLIFYYDDVEKKKRTYRLLFSLQGALGFKKVMTACIFALQVLQRRIFNGAICRFDG